ncbi:MAG: energy transducer TonB [Bacteroidales bacterium]|nr:energy transducer TonB [Bacteroidales bacterium]
MKRTIVSLLLVLTAVYGMAQNAKLQGRTAEGVLPKPTVAINKEGVVVVSIWVDQYGTVQRAEAGADGTTIVDSKVWAAARSAALGAHFNISADAPALQKGTITYVFRGNKSAGALGKDKDLSKVKRVTVREIVEEDENGLFLVQAEYENIIDPSELIFSVEDQEFIIPIQLVKKDLGAARRFTSLNLQKGDTLVIQGTVDRLYVFNEHYKGLKEAKILEVRPVVTIVPEVVKFISPQPAVEEQTAQKLLEKPTFKGGDANEFAEWVNSQLRYPKVAKENGVQGRVTLQFIIKADGSVADVKVLRSVDSELDKEAVRVVSKSPKWKPGYNQDGPVDVTYTFPVIFQLR